MKRCFKCGEEKLYSCFYKHSQMKDGYLNKCKDCTKADVSKNYRDNIEHYKEYERYRAVLKHRIEAKKRYSVTVKGKIAGNKAKRKWVEANPIKRLCAVVVRNAVRRGGLIKPKFCETCGIESKRIHGHHCDYAFPLDVMWLCSKCHAKWHKENGEGLNG